MKKQNLPRRNFLKKSTTSLAAITLGSSSLVVANNELKDKKLNQEDWTVQAIIDLIVQEIPGGPKENTVDTTILPQFSFMIIGVVSNVVVNVYLFRRAHRALYHSKET